MVELVKRYGFEVKIINKKNEKESKNKKLILIQNSNYFIS
jgi:acetolactate synthase regulatory subunit